MILTSYDFCFRFISINFRTNSDHNVNLSSLAFFPFASDDEEEGSNPMVAGFQDDLDSEDELAVVTNTSAIQQNPAADRTRKFSTASSSSDDQVKPAGPSSKKKPVKKSSTSGKVVMALGSDASSSDAEQEKAGSNPVVTQDADISSDEEGGGQSKNASLPAKKVAAVDNSSKGSSMSMLSSVRHSESSQQPALKVAPVSALNVELSESEDDSERPGRQVVNGNASTPSTVRSPSPPAEPVIDKPKSSSTSKNDSLVASDGGSDADTAEGAVTSPGIIELPQEDLNSWLDQFESQVRSSLQHCLSVIRMNFFPPYVGTLVRFTTILFFPV